MKYGGLVGNVIMGVYLISLSYSDMKKKKTKCWSDCIGISFGTGFSGNYWYRIMESCCRRNFNRVSFLWESADLQKRRLDMETVF